MSGPIGGAPQKYRLVYKPLAGQHTQFLSTVSVGPTPTPATSSAAAIGVPMCHHLPIAVCTTLGTLADPTSYHLHVLQLWEGRSLCSRLSFCQERESV
jgi:hypothetical protein